MKTFSPLFFNKRPKEDAVIPFPSDETTPPVTKIYFVMSYSSCNQFLFLDKKISPP